MNCPQCHVPMIENPDLLPDGTLTCPQCDADMWNNEDVQVFAGPHGHWFRIAGSDDPWTVR